MNEQTLELQIKTQADGMISSVNLLNSKLNTTKQNVDKVSTSVNKLGKAFSAGVLFAGVKRLTKTLLDWTNLAVDRTEQLNLFNVVFKNMEKNGKQTFSELGKSATQFQYKLNETFGTNFTDTTKYQALFQSMGQNVGIEDKYSAIMSETMTKLTYDLGSLYNKSEKDVAEALRAGVYAGQTKPLRAYGVDVTQTSLTPVAQSLGITDRSVKEMSQAEKEILRYIATLRQARVAMGDYANTIESPANQTKVFKNTLVEAKVALTSLFIGTFSKILPYANAILMVIKEVSKAIATMFGIKLQDYNSGIASQAEAYEGLGESMDGATDSAKKLKREVLSFDQIHNINEDNDSGGSSGVSGLTGGIDQRLLDAITGYDNGMDKVRMKATEIRDKIMEWLGFTKHINAETGETYFTFDNTNTALYKILKAIQDIVKYGKIAVTEIFKIIANDLKSGMLGDVIADLLNIVASIVKLISQSKTLQQVIAKILEVLLLYKALKMVPFMKNIISMVGTTLLTSLKNLVNSIGNTNKKTEELKNQVNGAGEAMKDTTKQTDNWTKLTNGAKTAVSGLITAGVGLFTVYESMKNISKEGPNVTNVLTGVTGALGTISGFASIGSIFGPIGTGVGIAVGAVATLVTSLMGLQEESKKTDEAFEKLSESIEEHANEWQQLEETKKKYISENTSETEYYEHLYKELKNIVDVNGKIKSGYEDRANFIVTTLNDALGLEISIVDGQVQKYKELEQSIKDVITQKRAQILLEAEEDKYKEAIKNKTTYASEYASMLETATQREQELDKYLDEVAKSTGLTSDEVLKLANAYNSGNWDSTNAKFEKASLIFNDAGIQVWEFAGKVSYLQDKYIKADEALAKSKNTYYGAMNTISNYEKAYELALNGNYDALQEFLQNEQAVQEMSSFETKKYYKKRVETLKENLDELEKNRKNYSDEEYEAEKKRLETLLQLNEDELKWLVTKTSDITDDMVDAWGSLAQSSEEEFTTRFKKLPKKIQQEIVDKMYDKGYKISEELQKGIGGITPTVKVKANVEDAKNAISGFISQISSNLTTTLNVLFKKANGGAFYNGRWHDIEQYANGGAPSHGSVFVAGEAGTEMVGHINGRTEVLNQSQMASVMYNAVASAMANQSASKIELYAHTDDGVIIDRINQVTKQTGVCPINIPY